jgi:hypothetical protein
MLSDVTINHFRLLQPETIDLERAFFEKARQESAVAIEESQQWQLYLNVLARVGFTQWLSLALDDPNFLPDRDVITLDSPSSSEVVSLCQVGDFRFCLLTVEHILNETVTVPQSMLYNLPCIPHFYIVLEILEEQDQIIFRGFLRYDQFLNHLEEKRYHPLHGLYNLALSAFDAESNHLLFDCRYLDLEAMIQSCTLPQLNQSQETTYKDFVSKSLEVKTTLSHWLEGFFEESWRAIDDLVDLQIGLAFSTRNGGVGVQRGKIINLGIQLKERAVALLINVSLDAEDRRMVLVQLHPTTGERYLAPEMKLVLLSKAGKILQEVKARGHDNYIQLKPFAGEVGKSFSLVCSYDEASHQEDFVL